MTFPISKTIEKLESYTDSSFPILSVYLSIPQNQKISVRFADIFHTILDTYLDEKERTEMEKDALYIHSYLEGFENTHVYKSLAFFSGNDSLWEVINGYFTVPDFATVSYAPYLEPLFLSISDFQRYLVVLADKEKAKFFTIFQGEAEDYGEMYDPSVPQKVKGSNIPELSGKIERHIQMHEAWHFEKIADALEDFTKGKYINGVLIGGHKETMHFLEDRLPERLRKKILLRFASELNVTINQLVDEAKAELERYNKKLAEKHQKARHFTL